MPEIHNGKDLWQWSWLEIRLNVFRWSTIPQKQFIIIYCLFKIKGNVNNKVSVVKATITTLKSKTGDFNDGLKLFYEGL